MLAATAALLACLSARAVDEALEVSFLQGYLKLHGRKDGAHALELPSRVVWPDPGDPDLQPAPAQKLIMMALKADPLNEVLANATMSAISLIPVWYVAQEGGYDILFNALHRWARDPTVQMNAWRGLSDQAHTRLGSGYIADYGGPNRGIEYMVGQLRANPAPRGGECVDHLTYQYEVLRCIAGLLRWDVNGTRGAAAVRAGLLPAALHTLRVEADLRPSAHTACDALSALLTHNASFAAPLRELGAKELVQGALAKHGMDDPTPLWFGSTYGEQYPVASACKSVLKFM